MRSGHIFGKQLASLLVWAGGSFALALALGLPATSNAVDDSNSPSLVATIVTPKLSANGIDLSVALAAPSTQPSSKSQQTSGTPLKLLVRTVNRMNVPVTASFDIQLESMAPVSVSSRVLPAPTQIWRDSAPIVLRAGEQTEIAFTPSKVPDHKFLIVLVTFGGQSAQMMTLSPAPSGQYTLAQ